jgi:hypothetical protein
MYQLCGFAHLAIKIRIMIKIMKTRPDLFPSLFPRFRAMLDGG